MACFAIALTSCGGKTDSNSVTLNVESDFGALSDYVTISESEITLKLVENAIQGSVGVNVTKAFEGQYSWDLEFEVEVLDENHISIAKLRKIAFDHPVLENVVNVGNKHLEITNNAEDVWEKIKNEGKYISIKFDRSSEEIMPYSGSTSDSSSDDDDSSYSDSDDSDDDSYSSSGSQDWDALLDSYEEYVDKYISYVKKAAKGDMSALSEYPALMEKAQEFSEKMQNAQGDMSSSQWSRYMRITNKMTQAAANM